MTFDPTDWQTWTRNDDHPIFGDDKSRIANWSHDPSQYCDLNNYSKFMPEWYVHLDPPPSTESQQAIATHDIANLATSCKQIIERYGDTSHEIVILDDFTVFVWMNNEHFSLRIYPLKLDGEYKLMLFAEPPLEIDELRCRNVNDLVQSLAREIGR